MNEPTTQELLPGEAEQGEIDRAEALAAKVDSFGASLAKRRDEVAALFNVAPAFAELDGRDNLVRDAKFCGDVSYSSLIRPDEPNDFVGQYGVWVAFANLASALFIHVLQVVGLCSKRKMLWVNASRVVAFVHDNPPRWNRGSGVKFVSDSVGKLRPVVYGESAVSLLVNRRLPFDAAIAFVQKALGPESFFSSTAISLFKSNVWVAVLLKAQVVLGAIAKRLNRQGAADGASAHVQPPSVEFRVMRVLGSLHGNRFSAAKPSQAGAF